MGFFDQLQQAPLPQYNAGSVGDILGRNDPVVRNAQVMSMYRAPQMRAAPVRQPPQQMAPQMRAAPQPKPQPLMGMYGGGMGGGPLGRTFMTSLNQGQSWRASGQNPNAGGWTQTSNDPDGKAWMR